MLIFRFYHFGKLAIRIFPFLYTMQNSKSHKGFSLAIHGGAGTILPEELTPEKELIYRTALDECLQVGQRILEDGGTAMDAVEATVVSLENNPLFNAGKGAVFCADGSFELDASIMDGKTMDAGAVAGLKGIANPIKVARKVFEKTPHVLLAGKGALDFARSIGFEEKPDSYFFTQHRYDQFAVLKGTTETALDHGSKPFGTVGAVAKDIHGNIAAATSTGGMTNKQFGRLGDTPIIGSGTYANNKTCAISATGHGEYFMKSVVAYDISCLMEYAGLSLEEACHKVVNEKLVAIDGEGGLIAVDQNGTICLPFNSLGMYRGSVTENGKRYTAIHKD